MSENRETHAVNEPSEEPSATPSEVLAAVERSRDAGSPSAAEPEAGVEGSADPVETGTAPEASPDAVVHADAAPAAPRGSSVGLDTEPYTVRPDAAPRLDDLPSAAASPAPAESATVVAPTAPPAAAPGEIRISADHPMAALYMQTPMPPDMKGNRGAGVAIAVVATLGFAVVFAGVLALWRAPLFPPSTYLNEGLLPVVFSWGFATSCLAFFVALSLLVLVVGRAGWWAYVLGGFVVAGIVWAAATVGFALSTGVYESSITSWNPLDLADVFGRTVPALGAALVAREATIWFGAWIGRRGRRITAKNAAAMAEYEQALAEVRAQQA